MNAERMPCPFCGTPIVIGARKCRGCKTWLSESVGPTRSDSRSARTALTVGAGVFAVFAVIVTSGRSEVEEAPPLTELLPDPETVQPSASTAKGPPDTKTANAVGDRVPGRLRARDFLIGDAHPLDIVFHPNRPSVFVSADDATLREYSVPTGELLHKASIPAQGDRLRLLFGRYLAALRAQDAARIPLMDTLSWDRDPLLLDVGEGPGDVVEDPSGQSVIAATRDSKRLTRFAVPGGRKLENITLPHPTAQLFLVRSSGRAYVAAVGGITPGNRPTGAWLDLFDPSESPFAATRRSIAVGREPTDGDVSAHGQALLIPDRMANSVTLFDLDAKTDARQVSVGVAPEAAFFMNDDHYGLTINSGSRTVSVVNLQSMTVESTLMLNGVPRKGAVSADGKTLFVALGGTETIAKGQGVAIIAGDPLQVVATLPTGHGACAVTVSGDGKRAAIANYQDKSITIVEP